MINRLLDGGGEINPFTNYASTKYKLINVWLLIKMLPLVFINGNAGEHGKFREKWLLQD